MRVAQYAGKSGWTKERVQQLMLTDDDFQKKILDNYGNK